MKKLTEANAVSRTLILIVVTFALRCLIAAYTGLGIGESYYFRGSMHLNLSYFDQPPLFFWLGGLGIKLFGLNNLGIRFPSVLLFAGTTWLLFLVTKKLFHARAGYWAAVIMNLSGVFTVGIACWFQPDAPLLFFWLAATYFIVEIMITTPDAARMSRRRIYGLWIAVGIGMGLATLSKYHVAFLFAGVFIFVATNKTQRHWLSHPGPYLAILITFIMALPVLWWNYNNGWVSFIFQGSRAGANTQHFQLHFDWFFRSIAGQALWLLPWIWFPTVRQLFISYKLRAQMLAYSFSFWMSVLPIVFFTVVTLWADLQYHFHWQAPGYMMLFMPLGFAVDKCMNSDAKGSRLTRRWLYFSVFFTVITIGVLSLHMVTGFWQSYGPKWVVRHFHGDNTDPTIQGIDYNDIQTRFEKEGWLQNQNIFAGSDRWWLMGKIDWALKGKKDIVVFDKDPRNLAFLVDPKALTGKDAVVIQDGYPGDIAANVKPFFDRVKQLPDIEITRNGIVEYKLQVYYCTRLHVPSQKRMDLPVYRQLIGLPPFGK
jgi:hypothetical protein